MLGEVMKSLVRWGITLGLLGNTMLATIFSGNAPVLALPDEQIAKTMARVPVFVIATPQGNLLTHSAPNGQKTASVTEVFMSPQDAQSFIQQVQNKKDQDPKIMAMAKTLQVTPVPLGVIYQQARKNAKQPNSPVFVLNPEKGEIDGALALLRQSGQQIQQFNGVPVFLVRSAPNQGYVSIKMSSNNKQDYMPLFFSKEEAQGLLNQVKPKFPKADIQVVDVEGVIKKLQEKNDPALSNIVFFPSPDAKQYIQTLIKNNPPNSSATPGVNQAPAQKK